MNVSAPATPESSTAAAPDVFSRLPAAELDASCRGPVLLFFNSGIVWLIAGLFLSLIATVKLHVPGFFPDVAWFTVGRIKPAALNLLLYGFGIQTGLGVLLWLICRLGGTELLNRGVILFGGLLWNIGVGVGLLGVLAGHSTGYPWLEIPRSAAFLLFAAYALIGIWVLLTFHYRRQPTLYVSQWYLLAAIFWFPWIYSAAIYLLFIRPVRGVMQSVVQAWFSSNLLHLWFLPVALATIYYFIPKLARRPLHSEGLAAFGFWTYTLFASCIGLTQFVGGPFPAWMLSVSLGFNLLLMVPIVCFALNWYHTLDSSSVSRRSNLTLQAVVFAGGAFVIGSVSKVLLGTKTVSRLTEFTLIQSAWTYWMFLGVFGLAAFGAIYYITPRVSCRPWDSEVALRRHFLCSVWGLGILCAALAVGGLIQGARLQDPATDFVRAIRSSIPFLGLSTLGLLLLLIGQFFLAASLCRMCRDMCRVCCPSFRSLFTPATPVLEVKR